MPGDAPIALAANAIVMCKRVPRALDPAAERDDLDSLGIRRFLVPFPSHEALISFDFLGFSRSK
jgi:hypothetical protein